jgi:hypothetical protein
MIYFKIHKLEMQELIVQAIIERLAEKKQVEKSINRKAKLLKRINGKVIFNCSAKFPNFAGAMFFRVLDSL